MKQIYVDGACEPNPGRGSWSVVLENDIDFGVESYTTNNRMEMKAFINAFKYLSPNDHCLIYSDSNLTVNIYNGLWNGKKNIDLVKELRLLRQKYQFVKGVWIKGHSGIYHNEVADFICEWALCDYTKEMIKESLYLKMNFIL